MVKSDYIFGLHFISLVLHFSCQVTGEKPFVGCRIELSNIDQNKLDSIPDLMQPCKSE